LEYYFKALDIVKGFAKKSEKDLNTIAMLNSNIGATYIRLEKYDEALVYLKESITVRILSGDKYGKAQSFHNIASLYFRMKKYTKSLKYYEKSIALKEEISDQRGLIASYIGLAELYHKQGNSLNTEFYLKKAVELAEKINNVPLLLEVYKKISVFYEEVNYYKESLQYFKKYYDINNSFRGDGLEREINSIKIKYDMLNREKDAEIFRLRNILLKEANDEIARLKVELEKCRKRCK